MILEEWAIIITSGPYNGELVGFDNIGDGTALFDTKKLAISAIKQRDRKAMPDTYKPIRVRILYNR